MLTPVAFVAYSIPFATVWMREQAEGEDFFIIAHFSLVGLILSLWSALV